MPKLINITGQRFKNLVAVRYAGASKWICLCDCGKETVVRVENLKSGNTKSCGCRKGEVLRARLTVHGHALRGAASSTYSRWASMMNRCHNPNDQRYADYGGRGIKVCERWHTFANFLADMGEAPPGMYLDRINVNGNYEPGNCRWVTASESRLNRRDTKSHLNSPL